MLLATSLWDRREHFFWPGILSPLHSSRTLSRKTKTLWLAMAALAVTLLCCSVPYIRAHLAFNEGQKLLEAELWPQAREQLARYVKLHPSNAQARLMMAEALIQDSEMSTEEATKRAIAHLQAIPSTSELAGEAILREARLTFFILQLPSRAERLVHKAIELDSDDLLSQHLLWTILNMTGRHELTEDVFWRIYELTDPKDRVFRLREWYMSQFFPNSSNEALDRRMYLLGPNESSSPTTVSRRYLRFREREPGSPIPHAALAQWCQQEGDPDFGKTLVDAAASQLKNSQESPFFLATQISIYLDLGEFETAKACIDNWPKEDRSRPYWMWKAIVLDDVEGKLDQALQAYDKAMVLWPSHMDWRLQHRRAECLTRLNRPKDAEAQRAHAATIREIMVPELHITLREALENLADANKLQLVVEFYERLGRKREAAAWREHLKTLN